MGEYAIRRSDGEEVKIGTREGMYYLRYEQRGAVAPLGDNVNPAAEVEELWFRLPRKEEEGIAPGDFDYLGPMGAKPLSLYVPVFIGDGCGGDVRNPLYDPHRAGLRSVAGRKRGTLQCRTDNDICVNVPCYHGAGLELPEGMFYSGHVANQLAAFAVGVREGVPSVLVGCRFCGTPLLEYGGEEFFATYRPWFGEEAAFAYLRSYMERMEATAAGR